MVHTKNVTNQEETTVETNDLIKLAAEFGLACVENEDSVTVIGLDHLLIFKLEENKCQLTEIY